MGLAHVSVTVRGLDSPNGGYTENFLADSGATYSMVAEAELVKIGVKPEDTMVYELADSTRHTYKIGFARFTVEGTTRVGSVISGPKALSPSWG